MAKRRRRTEMSHSTAVFAAPGYLLYSRGESLVAHEFDDAQETLVGEPTPLGFTTGGSLGVSGFRSISVSTDGTLVLRADQRNLNHLLWVDRAGRDLADVTRPGDVWHSGPRLSPDGRLVAVAQYGLRGGLGEVWIHDVVRKVSNRITFGEGDDGIPTWIGPRELLYQSTRQNVGSGIYRLHLDRPNDRRLWLESAASIEPLALTRDGRVVLERYDQAGQPSLWIRDLEGTNEAVRLGRENVSELGAELSPDGRWLAFVSAASRSWEVYLRRLDGTGSDTRISPNGGTQPSWRRDGRELYYVDIRGRIVAAGVTWPTAGGDPVVGEQVPLFDARLEESTDRQYDVSADGQRFLLNRTPTFDQIPITVVLDWRALLHRTNVERTR